MKTLKLVGKHVLVVLRTIVYCALALVVGSVVLGIPYAGLVLLAGGPDESGRMSPFFFYWPVPFAITILVLMIENMMRGRRGSWIPGPITACWLVFCFLPIIMCWTSRLLSIIGLEPASQLVFKYRWDIRPAIFFGFMFMLIAGACAKLALERIASAKRGAMILSV